MVRSAKYAPMIRESDEMLVQGDTHARPGWIRILMELGKVRITIAVTLTTTLGYLMARHRVDCLCGCRSWGRFCWRPGLRR